MTAEKTNKSNNNSQLHQSADRRQKRIENLWINRMQKFENKIVTCCQTPHKPILPTAHLVTYRLNSKIHMNVIDTSIWMKIPRGTKGDLSPDHIMLDRDPVPPPAKGAQHPPSAHVYCDHGRPSQLLLSSYTNGRPETLCCVRVKVSAHILALLFDLPSVLRTWQQSVDHWTLSNRNWKRINSGNDKHRSAPLWRFCNFGQIWCCRARKVSEVIWHVLSSQQ